MVRRKPAEGFTLIEVTLAIVIGIVMIAGATLIYNQAKVSSGNSRAQEKVVSLQQLVEEFAAQNQGVYPNNLGTLNALWLRKRPDDFGKSPWGGQIGSTYPQTPVASAVASIQSCPAAGVGGALTITALNYPNGAGVGLPTTNMGAETNGGTDGNNSGGLVYDFDGGNSTWSYSTDLITNGPVTVKGYAVYICNTKGQFPNYVAGGKAN